MHLLQAPHPFQEDLCALLMPCCSRQHERRLPAVVPAVDHAEHHIRAVIAVVDNGGIFFCALLYSQA